MRRFQIELSESAASKLEERMRKYDFSSAEAYLQDMVLSDLDSIEREIESPALQDELLARVESDEWIEMTDERFAELEREIVSRIGKPGSR